MSFCRGKKTRVYGEQSREKHSKPKCTEAEKLKQRGEISGLQRQEKLKFAEAGKQADN
jgi:hypothetical protein